MCMYVCMYVYMYVCMCMYMYMYVCMYVYMYVCMCMYVCMYVYMYICMYMYECMHACTHVCVHMCMCMHVGECVHEQGRGITVWDWDASDKSCFEVIDSDTSPFRLKIKEAIHTDWVKPNINKQQKLLKMGILV